MPPRRFVLLTVLGAGIWTDALATAGYFLGEHFEGVDKYLGPVSTAIMVGLLLLYVWRVIRFKPGKAG